MDLSMKFFSHSNPDCKSKAFAWLIVGCLGLPIQTGSEEIAPAVILADSVILDLPEREVKAEKKLNNLGPVEVKSDFIRKFPSTMNDPIRAVNFAPGVTVQNDVNIRPYVRGGDADQTRVVMNGIPLLQPYHVGGTFSIFNLSTLESVGLYKEDFPVEYPGALSGILRLKTKSQIPDRPHARTNLSLIRGDLFAEIPIIKNRLSFYGAYQSFLFNKTLHGLLDLTTELSKDSVYKGEMQGYRDHINMPNFNDLHWGGSFLPKDNLRIDYMGGFSGDGYAVVVPKQTNILSRLNPKFGDPSAALPDLAYKRPAPRAQKLSVDSISNVAIDNQTHFMNLAWDATDYNLVENNLGFQSQDWTVAFKKNTSNMEPLSLTQSMRTFNYRFSDTYSPNKENKFVFGAAYDYKWHAYDMHLPYVLYDVIVNGNMDMLEPLGYFSDQGFTISKEDSSRTNFDYLGEFPSRIQFNHVGSSEDHFGSIFYSHELKFPTGSFTYGFRGEFQNTSKEFFPAPRLDYKWKLDENNILQFNTGLFSQNDLAYYKRDRNRALKSEKSGELGTQWTHLFRKGYHLTWSGYYKHYFDLVTPTLVPNNTLDLKGFLIPLPSSRLSEPEIIALKSTLDTTSDFYSLPDSIQAQVYETFGGLEFNYANSGIGNSLGSELSFFYTPTAIWNGWISLDLSLSNRRDQPDESYYSYRYHRPIVCNWVNYFDMPGSYDISLTYRWALGQPYTPYSGDGDGRGSFEAITVGHRNAGRLSPYSRLDLRLTRNGKWRSGNFKAFLEVWNSMNSPNYFARDNASGKLKSAQLNWPFPVFFLGVSGEI
jgi:TonB-dependent Receptor Plug Domain